MGKKSPLRIEFQTNMFLQKYGTRRPNIYDISNFLFPPPPLQLFLHFGYSRYPRVTEKLIIRERSSVRNLDKLLKKEIFKDLSIKYSSRVKIPST